MRIAVDFDGTIVEHKYPEIGEEMLFAFETLKMLQKQRHQLILWTCRSGKYLDEAVEYCSKNGIIFYAVNKNYPEEEFQEDVISRKIDADIYIDDRNIGGFLGWGKIWQIINNEEFGDKNAEIKMINKLNKKKSFFKKLFSVQKE